MEMEDFTILMKALSDANRVRALVALKSGELCVCQIIELLELAPSTVSKHMSILKQAKLVQSRKTGRWIYYRRSEADVKIIQELTKLAITALSDAENIVRDQAKLKAIKQCGLEELCKQQRGESIVP